MDSKTEAHSSTCLSRTKMLEFRKKLLFYVFIKILNTTSVRRIRLGGNTSLCHVLLYASTVIDMHGPDFEIKRTRRVTVTAKCQKPSFCSGKTIGNVRVRWSFVTWALFVKRCSCGIGVRRCSESRVVPRLVDA